LINETPCFGPNDIYHRDDVLVIVAMISPEAVLKQLEANQVRHITTIGTLKKLIFNLLPDKVELL